MKNLGKALVVVLLFGVAFCFSLGGVLTIQAILHPVKYYDIIQDNSIDTDLAASLLASVINVESSYDRYAISSKNALGLMQIKLSTAEYVVEYFNLNIDLTEDDLFSPEINIHLGSLYLSYLIQKFSNISTALAAYNAGETRVNSWLKNTDYSTDGKSLDYIPYKETSEYISKIKTNQKFYSKIYP